MFMQIQFQNMSLGLKTFETLHTLSLSELEDDFVTVCFGGFIFRVVV